MMEEKTTILPEDMEETRGFDLESIEELKDSVENDLNDSNITTDDSPTEMDFQSLEGIITEEDVEDYTKYLETLNFIELMKAQREFKSYERFMRQMKETAESLIDFRENLKKTEDDLRKDMESDSDNIADNITLSNMEDDVSFKDAREFLDHYDESMENLDTMKNTVEEFLKKFEEVPKTSSYMNNAMLEVINKNLKKIEDLGNPSSYKRAKRFYQNQQRVFANRDSVDYLVEKIPDKKIMITNLKRSLKKDKKQNRTDTLTSTQKSVAKAFGNVFNVNQLSLFEEYLSTLYGSHDDAFYVQYALYLIYSNEKKFGKIGNHKWVEVVIMNVLDILSDKYDLESGKDNFDMELFRLREVVCQ